METIFAPGSAEWEWRPVTPVAPDGHFVAQADAFLDQIEGRAAPLCSLESGVQTLRFNLAALASSATGARVACATIS